MGEVKQMFRIKKILMSCVCLFCFFGFANIVKANNSEITLVQECEYKPIYGKLKGDHGENGQSIYIGYTQLRTPSGGTFEIQARYNRSKEFEHLGDIKDYFGFNVDHQSNTAVTYASAVNGNAGACPKYMTIELISDDDHKPLFYNDLSDSSQCNDNPSTKCKAYFSLVKTISNVKIDPTEKYWSYTTAADNTAICSDLTFKISISGNQLVGIANYGRNTKFTEEKNPWTSPKPLQDLTFDDVHDLATKSKFTNKLYFNPDDGGWGGKTSIGIGGEGTDYCYTTSNLSTQYSCATASELKATITSIENRIATAYPDIQTLYSQNTKWYGNQVGPMTYENYHDADSLLKVIDKINTGLDAAVIDEAKVKAIENDLNKITSGEYQVAGKSACKDAKILADDAYKKLQQEAKYFTGKLQTLQSSSKNALSRLEELKEQGKVDDETYNQAAANVNAIEVKISSNIKMLDRVRAGMLEGMDFRFSFDPDSWDKQLSTCGVLSSDMKDFIDLILWYIKIAGVILAIILSLADYIKAASGSDDKSMANANKRVLMRIIFVAILFLVPAILEFILGALNISTTAGSLKCLR